MQEMLIRLADDDTVDQMTFILAVALAQATVDLDNDEMWNAPPRLCVVFRRLDSADTADLLVTELGPLPEASQLSPVLLLAAAADMMQNLGDQVPKNDIVGWLFVTEAWLLTGPDPAQLEKIAQERLGPHDPDATECRVAVLVDRAGRIYQTLTERGSGAEPTMMVSGPGGNSSGGDGRILQLLQHLMDVTPVSV